MISRRNFIKSSVAVATGTALLPSLISCSSGNTENVGIQLYTVRKEIMEDAAGTLKKLADIGFKQIESARSPKGHYYGFSAKEMKKICDDLGMTLRSGHVHLDDNFEQTMNEAAESGQEYLICSSMPTQGQTVDNYKAVAERFNQAGEECKKLNLKFGYHNHAYEFESDNGSVLYDVLLDNTSMDLVHMELDLGWVVAAGSDPLDYFKRYEGRFPLWHLKDMNMEKKESTEFGKGGLDIALMLKNKEASGLKYYFVEQEEYTSSAFESMQYNMDYLKNMSV